MSYKDMSSKMNNVLQDICSIYSISCCLPSWFHLQLHRGFSGVFMVVCLKDSKCESGVLLVRQIQIKNTTLIYLDLNVAFTVFWR